MIKIAKNPCVRCGKERIVAKKWTEIIETASGIKIKQINTENVCPDKECQAIVDIEIRKQKEKRDKVKKDREDAANLRKTQNPRNKKKK